MRTARWAVGGALHSSAQLNISSAGGQLLLSPTTSLISVGTANSKIAQPPSRDLLITDVAPSVRSGIVRSPASGQILLTTSIVLIPISPWSVDFSADFGAILPIFSPWSVDFSSDFGGVVSISPASIGIVIPCSQVALVLTTTAPAVTSKLTILPGAGQILTSTTAPISRVLAPAAQLILTKVAPVRSVGRSIQPPRTDKLFSPTAPRILPGRYIIPPRTDKLLTTVSPTFLATAGPYTGLSFWGAHTFAVGEQCQNLGLAYQCITAGVSTIAPTGTGSNIVMGGDGAHFMYIGITGEASTGMIISSTTQTFKASQNNLADPAGPWDTWGLTTTGPTLRNKIPNSINQGASGTVLPTGWGLFLDAPFSTSGCVGSGITAGTGYPYVDFRAQGTMNANDMDAIMLLSPGNALGNSTAGIPATPATTYTISCRISYVAGSTANIFLFLFLLWEADAGGGFVNLLENFASGGFPVTATETLVNYTFTTDANTAFVQPAVCVQANNGAVVQITLRVAGIQFEAGGAATSYQRTPRSNFYPTKNATVDPGVSGASKIQYAFNTVYWSDGTNYWGWKVATSSWVYTGTSPAAV